LRILSNRVSPTGCRNGHGGNADRGLAFRDARVAVVGKTNQNPSVVHFFDCADVGKTLVTYGKQAGYNWRHSPAQSPSLGGKARAGAFQSRYANVSWRVRRTVEALRADLMHVHFGTRGGVAKSRPVIPFVMHWHGTDIRDPGFRPSIQWGADHAAAVVYSTPDLRQHAENVRPDAIHLPNPVDLAELPTWNPAGPPRVLFASRWEDSKGGVEQFEIAAAIREVTHGQAVLEGLDWGNRADEARSLGISLVPTMPKPRYLQWLSGAHCVVGQSAGILAMSELQALAIGIPVVMNVGDGYYKNAPVLSGGSPEDLAAQVLHALDDPLAISAQVKGREWVEQNHSPGVAVEAMAAIYRRVMEK
jgi:glycosyltransferase involved in cell wall biosynthesis